MHFPKPLFLVMGAVALSACMLSPWDGQRLSSPATPVRFNGYHLSAGSEVRLEGFNPATGSYESFGTTRSALTADPTAAIYITDPLFRWDTTVAVPTQFWAPGAVRGARARVKSTTQAGSLRWALTSVEAGWGGCLSRVSSAGAFARECHADHNPEAWLTSGDYCHEGPLPVFRQPPAARLSLDCNDFAIVITGVGVQYPNTEMRVAWRGREEFHTNCTTAVGPEFGYAQCWGLIWPERLFRSRAEIEEAARAGDLVVAYRARTAAGASCDAPSPWLTYPVTINPRTFRSCSTPAPTPTPTPEPMPSPSKGPDLVVRIDSQDGYWARTSVCNMGSTAVMTSRFFMTVRGSAMTADNEVSLESYLPSTGLTAGQCVGLGDLAIAGTGGAGAGAGEASTSVRMCVDTRGQVLETNEANNCTTR